MSENEMPPSETPANGQPGFDTPRSPFVHAAGRQAPPEARSVASAVSAERTEQPELVEAPPANVTPFSAVARTLAQRHSGKTRTVKVEFTGRNDEMVTYEVRMRRAKDAERWRAKMGAPIQEIVGLMQGWQSIEVNSFADIGGLLNRVNVLLLGSIEHIRDLVFEYDPELGNARDEIMEFCYDDEIVAAFMAIVRASYPFGVIVRSLPGLS